MVEKRSLNLHKKYHCQWTLLRGKKPKWSFNNFGILLRPLELVPASHERVVPTEWQVRTVLGDTKSKAKVISIRAPQHRQYALISDFLDLAHLSIREEAARATTWIQDRLQGLKLQNLALATMTGPALRSFPENMTADVQYAIDKMRVFGLKATTDHSQGIHRQLQGILLRIWQSFDVIFAEFALPVLYVASGNCW